MDLKSQIGPFQQICDKILQVYRIRLLCLQRRERVLAKFSNTTALGAMQAKDKNVFLSCIAKEEKILEIIHREGGKGETILKHTGKALKKAYASTKNKKGENKVEFWLINYGDPQIRTFIKSVALFFELLSKEIKPIKKRLEYEKKALESRQQDHIVAFLTQWKKEVETNREIAEEYLQLLNSHQEVMNRLLMLDSKKKDFGLGLATAASPYIAPTVMAGAVFVGIGAVLIVARRFLIGMQPLMQFELKGYQKDKDLFHSLKKKGLT